VLVASGCGYKKDPYYLEQISEDDNVEFFIKKEILENNETD